jgi:hypothetical protein
MTDPIDNKAAALPPSEFSRWRRRLSPLVLIGAVLLLGREVCNKRDAEPVTIHLSASQLDGRVTRLRGDIKRQENVIATFDRNAQANSIGAVTMKLPMPEQVVLFVEVFVDTRILQITRTLSPDPGSEVTVDVSAEIERKLAAK